MGWYHSMSPEEMAKAMGGDNAPTCSLSSRPAANENDSNNETSGSTACPLPPKSSPPPPPPDASTIYHLCQKENWEKAVKAKEPYFPPTFIADGKFTRFSVNKGDLVSTANTFYKDIKGDWIVLEIDCKTMYSLGIAILAQDAPESKPNEPVKCLQVFGGISTTLPGLIVGICAMERAPLTGKFLSILGSSSLKPLVLKQENGGDDKASKEPPMKQQQQAPEQAKKSKGKFRLFSKSKR